MIRKILKNPYIPAFLALIGIGYTIIFAHMERLPLHIWDEAHRAVNAQEILKNNEWIVITFDGKPDMYGTKPPMMVWLQAIFMIIFGMGELAVRLPSALAGLGICLSLFFALKTYLRNSWIPIIFVTALLSSLGFIYTHGIRFGDTDILLCFFIVLVLLNYFKFIERGDNRYLYYTFLFLIGGGLTKSVAILMMVPGLFIYTIYNKKLLSILKNKHFYIGIALFVIGVGWYYALREIKLPGYLSTVWDNEIGGRYFDTNDGHDANLLFYLKGFYEWRLKLWWLFLLSPVLFIQKDKRIKKVAVYSLTIGISYLVLISCAGTKLAWYDIPLYPIISIIGAFNVYVLVKWLQEIQIVKRYINIHVLLYVVVPLVFYTSVSAIIEYTFNPKQHEWTKDFYYISYFLREKAENKEVLENCFVLQPEDLGLRAGVPFHLSHMMFYVNIINRNGGDIRFIPKEQTKSGTKVITNSLPCKKYIESNFLIEIIEEFENVRIYRVLKEKI